MFVHCTTTALHYYCTTTALLLLTTTTTTTDALFLLYSTSSVSKISSGAFGGDKADSRSGAKWGAGKGDGSYFGVSMDDTATKAKSTAKKSLLKSSTPWNR